MKKDVFICNTVYQVFVALWMKHKYFEDNCTDIIVSDHMNDGERICSSLKALSSFNNCFFVRTKEFSYGGYKADMEDKESYSLMYYYPEEYIKRFSCGECRYRNIFISNMDMFAQIFYEVCSKNVCNCNLYIFEDGISTYTKQFINLYMDTRLQVEGFLRTLFHKFVYKKKSIFGNVKECYLFNPELAEWSADFPFAEIQKIDVNDKDFLEMCNFVFGFSSQDTYDSSYIFLEESFFADGFQINDCEIIEQIARRVGKDNIMIKIHPRNKINRFEILGYRTNKNTSVPWELVLMNNPKIFEKKLITISSTAALSPILLFGNSVRVYSIFNLINESGKKDGSPMTKLWPFFQKVIDMFPKSIVLLDDVKNIRECVNELD